MEGCSHAQAPSPEFRQRAIELALLGDKPMAKIAEDLGISESCLRNWVKQAEIDDGPVAACPPNARPELVADPCAGNCARRR